MDGIFEKAVAFAFRAHSGQLRKDGTLFILHPLETAAIVGTMTNDEEVLAAAVLHDTVEDTSATADDILANFGERVAELVAHETENKRRGKDPSETWMIRKVESLAVLKDSSVECKILWLGDKLSNIRSFSRAQDKVGDADLFELFNEKDPLKHRWYYATVIDYLKELSDTAAYRELKKLYHKVFGAYE